MAELSTIQHAILQTLDTQSEGYLCSPDASAFIAIGLENAEQVHAELVDLQNNGYVEYYEEEEHIDVVKVEKDAEGNPSVGPDGNIIPILNEEGNLQLETFVQIADSGWVITGKGKEALQ